MKNYLRPSVATLGLLLASFIGAQAQAPTQIKVKIDDVEISMQKTPEFAANVSNSKKDGKRREWLEIEMKFEVEDVAGTKIPIVPEILVQYYAIVPDIATRATQVLTDTVKYRNIEVGEDAYTVVYASPSSLVQLTGEMGKFKENMVTHWGVEILYNGRAVATASSTSNNSAWWTSDRAPQKRVTGLLAAKENTPFQLLWIDRHAEAILNK